MSVSSYIINRAGILLFVLGMISHPSVAETLDSRLKEHLEAIRAYNAGQTDAVPAPRELADALQLSIADLGRAVYLVDTSGSPDPSPERKAVIDRFAALIAPYNGDLVKFGFSSDQALSRLPRQCLSLLDHTAPDESFATALWEHANGLTKDAWFAYDLLFQHRLLTPAERTELGQKVLAEPDRERRIRWAVKCSDMAIPEVVPVLHEMLSTPFTLEGTPGIDGTFTENDALSNYRLAIQAINTLGPLAASTLPLLQARLKELEAALPPEQVRFYTPGFRQAMEQVQGRQRLRIPVAINGSGLLLASSPSATQTPATPVPTARPIASASPPETPVAQTPVPAVEHQAPVWPWIVGILALVVIAGLAFKRSA